MRFTVRRSSAMMGAALAGLILLSPSTSVARELPAHRGPSSRTLISRSRHEAPAGRLAELTWFDCSRHHPRPASSRAILLHLVARSGGRRVTVRMGDRAWLGSGGSIEVCPATFAALAPLGSGVVSVIVLRH